MASATGDAHQRRTAFLESMILSVSGWRAVFGEGDNSLSKTIAPEAREVIIVGAALFARALAKPGGTICVGTDTRPTGPVIAENAIRSILAAGRTVIYAGRLPSPEIMAFVKERDEANAFFYVTASHNPPGHNGFKLGGGDGAVLDRQTALELIGEFRHAMADDAVVTSLVAAADAVRSDALDRVYAAQPAAKEQTERAYRDFVITTAANSRDPAERERFVSETRSFLLREPIGIVAEMNGSARSIGADRHILPHLGVRLSVENDTPGTFNHPIVPEGDSLKPAARLLREAAAIDGAYQMAYVPDNDGDRGNLVFLERSGEPIVLEAQEVFALALVAELGWLHTTGAARPVAVAANGPTSLRADRIATLFGAELFRAEVGEANVVALAANLRKRGYTVRILGEGSNGGTIVHPATVRDPLNTILALLKFKRFDLFRTWCDVSGQSERYDRNATFVDAVQALPPFSTTNSNDDRAKMVVQATNHAALKEPFEAQLPRHIPAAIDILRPEFGPVDWRESNLEGSCETEGSGSAVRSGDERGGLRIVFSAAGRDVAAVWMRGSGTEPLFRILADVEGERPHVEKALLEWQGALVAEADDA